MKRFAWLLLALGIPLSSPAACGGDNCLRNSDCRSDHACRAGKCELKEPPLEASGGAETDEPPPTAGTPAVGGQATNAGSSGTGAGNASGGGNAGSPSSSGGGDGGQSAATEAFAGGAAAGEAGAGGASLAAGGAP